MFLLRIIKSYAFFPECSNIACKLVNVPTIIASMAHTTTNVHFMISTVFGKPDIVFAKTRYSINDGSPNPNNDKHSAPINEMNRSNVGIATASKTKFKMKKRITKSIIYVRLSLIQFYIHVRVARSVRKRYSQ